MPFERIPNDNDHLKPTQQCTSPEHNPPSNIVVQEPTRWRCPSCGKTVDIYPSTPNWAKG
jgi:predicted RNA-binding Zn-ribbon protein involved in translation (DUF1610 family)